MKKEPDYKWAAEKLKLLSSEEDDQFFKIIYARAAKIARDKAQKQIDTAQPLEHIPASK